MLRIAFLTHEPFYPPSGGGSAAAVYLVRELVARGHAVDVFGPAIPDATAVEARFGIRFRAFTGWRMGRTTPLRTPKYLAYPAALVRLVERTYGTLPPEARYQVLLAQHSISAVAAGRLKRRLGIPAIFNLLDCLTGFLETWPPFLMPPPLARALVNYELSLPSRFAADATFTVSEALRERLIQRGYPGERAFAIYYGYDSTLFRRPPSVPDAITPAREGPPRLVMHGSFDHHHLGPIALDALTRLALARPDLRLRLIGPSTPALRRLVERLRRAAPSAGLELPGFTPYDQIPAALAECSLGITPYEPSTGTHCAFVAKTVEYLALGLPVVSTPLESAVRYYRGLEAVKFAESGPAFAAAALAWLDLPSVARARAVEPARRKVEAELPWHVLCRRAVGLLERLAR